MTSPSVEDLEKRIRDLELENSRLRGECSSNPVENQDIKEDDESHLSLAEYKRYGRQMIVPEFGALEGQKLLKKSSILVIGAGGLGCPALLYISAAGVGTIGILDDDVVDVSNLHRQVLHTTESVGLPKVESARRYITKLNPFVKVETYITRISNENAFDIISKYDLILDCTDNPATRYLINDVSVLCGKTIVSGSGLKSDGQLSILNYQNQGPCYRCFYPKPPSPNSVTSCKDGGVLGPAIGLVGVTMALEAIKVLTGFYGDNFKPFLSMYTGYPQQVLRVFKMRNKQKTCAVCGENPSITQDLITRNAIDYVEFCGKVNANVLTPEQRITVHEYKQSLDGANNSSILLDVRPKEQFSIISLPAAINIPWDPTLAKLDDIDSYLPTGFDKETDTIHIICRYGNDSQLATAKLIELGFKNVKDIKGGINKWSEEIDNTVPIY
ncbi:adenylyltransferase and sulfurtransferase Uba4p [[Candida] anglica]